jgi:hypothetical protein
MLRLLSSHDWVPSDALAAEFCQYGRIIHQLRQEGFEIQNRVIRTSSGGKRGYFKWLSQREAMATRLANGQAVKPEQIAAAMKDDAQPTLFGDIAPTHRDEN